ncbi:NTP transferase domain-containing protein [Brevibacillus nitrificans]|uniref:NTP transferase domain-containing protein n=1 Tax=Brevibacillus nitrificans TaxID=651560 RepID=UPI0037BFFD9D
MAAGFSKRMGRQKLLLPYGPQSLLRHVVKKGLNTTASEVVVVINSQFEDLFSEISIGFACCHFAKSGLPSRNEYLSMQGICLSG